MIPAPTPPAPPPAAPAINDDDIASLLVDPDRAPARHEYEVSPASEPSGYVPAPTLTRPSAPRASQPASARLSYAEPESTPSTGSLREYSYWLLVLALIPLGFSLLGKEEAGFEDRLQETLEKFEPAVVDRIFARIEADENITEHELVALLPGAKLHDAHLPRTTVVHWVYAAVATAGFLLLILLMFSAERSHPGHLLGFGLFTATIGIVFLLVVQFCSQLRMRTVRVRGWVGLIMVILMVIGWSYGSALNPDTNFIASALGFTLGVGFCEELTKAIPLLFYFRRHATMGWRGACLWGLASGIGFGVSEGIMYSADYYNGISGPGIYVVRFVSCVALHAMWSGAVGIAIARTQDHYEGIEDWPGFILYLLRVLAVPMTLHGFYDTLLKKDMNLWALLVALASFAWLALQIERARGDAPEPEVRKTRRLA
jgi:RsiW-degrading membrane proteinase PrsW (M82 family)